MGNKLDCHKVNKDIPHFSALELLCVSPKVVLHAAESGIKVYFHLCPEYYVYPLVKVVFPRKNLKNVPKPKQSG